MITLKAIFIVSIIGIIIGAFITISFFWWVVKQNGKK